MIAYKACTKSELAEDAGVKMAQIRAWIKKDWNILQEFGLSPRSKNLSPAAVKFLAEKYRFIPHNCTVL